MKVLVVITTDFVSWGGLTSVIMNYYRAMDRTNISFDFASGNEPDKPLMEEIKKCGSHYFRLSNRKTKTLRYVAQLSKLIRKNKYDIVHVHGNSATMTFDLLGAVIGGARVRICHVHSTSNEHSVLHAILKPVMNRLTTHRIAVSSDAANYLYAPMKYCVLNNAIEVSRYSFNNVKRWRCRKALGIEDNDFVIGTVGKFTKNKNHVFVCDIFEKINKPNIKWLAVGDGPEKSRIEAQLKASKLNEKSIFVGMQTDTEKYLSAMDVFLFPSYHEGFGMALLEAEANGLECICSDTIPEQVQMSNCKRISVNEISMWCGYILEIEKKRKDVDRIEKSIAAQKEIVQKGLEISNQADVLRNYYNEAVKERRKY